MIEMANGTHIERHVSVPFSIRWVAPHIALACVLILLLMLSFAHYHRRHARHMATDSIRLPKPSGYGATGKERPRIVVVTPIVKPTVKSIPQVTAVEAVATQRSANVASVAETEMTELTTSGLDTLSEEAFVQAVRHSKDVLQRRNSCDFAVHRPRSTNTCEPDLGSCMTGRPGRARVRPASLSNLRHDTAATDVHTDKVRQISVSPTTLTLSVTSSLFGKEHARIGVRDVTGSGDVSPRRVERSPFTSPLPPIQIYDT